VTSRLCLDVINRKNSLSPTRIFIKVGFTPRLVLPMILTKPALMFIVAHFENFYKGTFDFCESFSLPL